MNKINNLHYITQDVPGKSHWQLAEAACKGGVRWVQLRVKNKSEEEWLNIALKTRDVCKKYGSTFIVNDNVEIAKASKADGVHLGKTDTDPAAARIILGDHVIIGGTANTFDDIVNLINKRVDYIGLGPYRFTATKEKLSPILGLEGFRRVINQCALKNFSTPVIAIGGILKVDIEQLLQTGVHGVAVASGIGLTPNIEKAANEFVELLNTTSHELTNS